MFTLQSGQIENALRTVGVPDVSAREMMSGLANCQSVIEHRGPMALTKPTINFFPTIRPAGPTISPRFVTEAKNTFVNIPPWQSVPFTPLPYLPIPPWETVPYPEWPTTPLEDPTLRVPGPVAAGPLTTPAANVTNLTTQTITNQGDIANQGDIINQGDISGDTVTVDGDLSVQNTSVFDGPVTFNGPVYHAGETITNLAHNQYTVNHGPTEHHSEAHFDGPTYHRGPNYISGPTYITTSVFVNGTPLETFDIDLVSDVVWESNTLKKTVKTVRVFGISKATATSTVIEGTECPA